MSEAIDQLVELMATEAGKEQIKHRLQAIIAAEVRETITSQARSMIESIIEEANRAVRQALISLNDDPTPLVEPYAKAVVERMGRFNEPKAILEAVAVQLQRNLEDKAAYNRANQLVEENREALMERVYASVDRRVNEVLREQLDFYKQRAEELTQTVRGLSRDVQALMSGR